MPLMLPIESDNIANITEVLSSCVESIRQTRATTSLILVVVDGLGEHNLRVASGHARFLVGSQHRHSVISTVFPSTTATALTSLMTGVMPLEHGIVGYRIRNPGTNELVNQLSELDSVGPDWMRSPTIAQRLEPGLDLFVVGKAKFADSALSRVIYRGATYVSAESLSERMVAAATCARVPGRIVLTYVSELDSAAHAFGVGSTRWASALEHLDDAVAHLSGLVDPHVTAIVTADHGVIDVDSRNHRLIEIGPLVVGVSAIGGEPRCLQLFVDSVSSVPRVVSTWREWVGKDARVLMRDDVISMGLMGSSVRDADVADRLGDVFILSESDVAFYDNRQSDKKPQRMIGQHGARSTTEMNVPLIVLTK